MVVPVGSELVPTTNGGAFTVMLNDWLTLCELPSCSLAVNVAVPVAVGVPVIAPADESVSPCGKNPEVIVHVYGETPPVPLSA